MEVILKRGEWVLYNMHIEAYYIVFWMTGLDRTLVSKRGLSVPDCETGYIVSIFTTHGHVGYCKDLRSV